MKAYTSRLFALAGVCGLAASALAGPTFRTVVLSGTPAPGLAGVTFSYVSDPRLAASGAAFGAELAGTGVTTANDGSLWAEQSGSLLLVQREGDSAGVGGTVVFGAFPGPVLTADGRTALHGSLVDTATPGPTNIAVYDEAPGRMLVAREGTPVPPPLPTGMPTWANLMPPVEPGSVLALSVGSGVGLWSSSGGSTPAPLALNTQTAPGTSGLFSFIDQPTGNAAGSLLFRSTTTSATQGMGLWSAIGGTVAPVAVAGAPAPGTAAGTVFAEVAIQPRIGAADAVTFWARVTGGGTSSAEDTGVWSGPASSPALVAREGQSAPGTPAGTVIGPIATHPAMGGAAVALKSDLLGPGIDATNNAAIFSTQTGLLALVAREGAQAPRLPLGVVFSLLGEPVMNESGQVAFTALLRGPGVTSANNQALYVSDVRGRLYPLARTGDQFDVGGGSMRLVDEIVFDSDPGTGRNQFMAGGSLIFKLVFRDPVAPPSSALSSGLFVGTFRCAPDVDATGQLNVNDFVAFQQVFAAGNLREADISGDGQLNINDFVEFSQAFAAGCP